jgi:glutathione S-transferase
MKLYGSPAACSLAVHIALHEAGLDAEYVRVDLATHRLADGRDYRAINPLGCVPLLEFDDGERVGEAPALLMWIAEHAPAAGLAPPAGTRARLHLHEALGFVHNELHPRFGALHDGTLPQATRQSVVAQLRTRLDHIAARLRRRAFLLGEAYSAADAYLFVVFGWCRLVGIDPADWPSLRAHAERVAQRPAVRAAMRAEGLVSA